MAIEKEPQRQNDAQHPSFAPCCMIRLASVQKIKKKINNNNSKIINNNMHKLNNVNEREMVIELMSLWLTDCLCIGIMCAHRFCKGICS